MDDQETMLLRQELQTHQRSLLTMALRLTNGNAHDAEDLVSETIRKALEALPTFKRMPSATVLAWLRQILLNTARDRAAKKKTKYTPNVPEPLATPSKNYGELLELVSTLPKHGKWSTFHTAVYLAASGMASSYDEVALHMLAEEGVPDPDAKVEATKVRIQKELSRLRQTKEFEGLLNKLDRRGALAGIGGIACTLGLGDLASAFDRIGSAQVRSFEPAPGASAIEAFDTFTRPSQLVEAMRGFEYTCATRNYAQSIFAAARHPTRLLNLAIPALLEASKANLVAVAGLLANVADKFNQRWCPDRRALNHAEQFCENALASGRVEALGWIEPLRHALDVFKRPATCGRFLRLAVEDVVWRRGTAELDRRYFGPMGMRIDEFKRHLVLWHS